MALYYCPSCDVFGKGNACWMCGLTEVKWGAICPQPRFGDHRHNPSTLWANVAGQSVSVEVGVETPLGGS